MENVENQIQLKGYVDTVTYRNRDNGYTVLKLICNKESLIVTGMMPFVNDGDSICVTGEYVMHPVYGRQFKSSFCEVSEPQTQAQILRYLSGGAIKGIGPATALKIVERFKDDSLDIIENRPEMLTAIKGISSEKAQSISEQFKQQFGIRDIMLTLSTYRISPDEATAIFKVLGVNSIEIIKNNPYVLCSEGIDFSFERVEEIAESFDIPVDNNFRIRTGIVYVLRSNLGNGHTCLPYGKLAEVSARLLSVDIKLVKESIAELIDSMELYSYDIDGGEFIFLPDYAAAEEYIAGRVKNILFSNEPLHKTSDTEIDFVQKRLGIELDPAQREAVAFALENSLFILTGGPGTGKTTTLRAIIEILTNRDMSVALAAPTGRAAKRMTELTGMEAKTLHRLLEVEWDNGHKPVYAKNKKNPLDYDVIIIDEMSMVDSKLFSSLLEATRITSRIILVGDADQLPSVGAGNVLNDLIASGTVPTVKLDKIFRQAAESSIVYFSHQIIKGNIPDGYEKAGDFFFLNSNDPYAVSATVLDLCSDRLPAAYGYSSFDDIQVLCPSRKKECGTYNINNLLQNRLNPLGKKDVELYFKGVAFRVGDKVINIKNDYDILWESDSGEAGTGIFNGDIGFITEIDVKNRMLKIKYDDKTATYYEENLGLIELAYAITIHKSQGCEFDCVVIPLCDVSSLLQYRNLLYTGITRAKKLIVLVGSAEIFARMIENDRKTLRYTALRYFLDGKKDE